MKMLDYKNEVKRKIIHLGALVLPIGYLLWFDLKVMLVLSGALSAVALGIEWLRFNHASFKRLFSESLGALLRPEEFNSLTAATWMILSVLITVLLFQKPVAILTLFYFIAGDGLASLIGIRFGKNVLFEKTAEGSAACLITCLIAGFLFSELPVWIWITGALVVTAVEIAPMKINDNIRVPFIGGSVMEILVWISKM